MYEGSAEAEIVAGKTAYVALYLRKTGSAQVNVIVEGVNDTPKVNGCFEISGRIDTVSLDGMILKVFSANGTDLLLYFFRDDLMIGKLYGTLNESRISGEICIPGLIDKAWFDGAIASDNRALKGEIYASPDRSQPLGLMYGNATDCISIPPPKELCITDTLKDAENCTGVDSLIVLATERCKMNGLNFGTYTFIGPCPINSEKSFHYICYECCKP